MNFIKTWSQESSTADLLYKTVLIKLLFFVSHLGGCNNNSSYTQEFSDHAENMAAMSLAKPPELLSLKDTTHWGKKWKQFKCDWTYYETVSQINKEERPIRVAHLLNVM